jgi:hypothetical protein
VQSDARPNPQADVDISANISTIPKSRLRVEFGGRHITETEIEAALRNLRSDLNDVVERGRAREKEWRLFGLISKIFSIVFSSIGAGLVIASVSMERTSANMNFQDHLMMLGLTCVVLNTPLLLLGAALHSGRRKPEAKA